ncbi:hypothetical protein BJX65DRAFT_312710 [Aspergillus insuetus]
MSPNQGKIDALGGNNPGSMNRHRKLFPDKREVIKEEDYNPPSKRRTHLLGRLNTVLNNRPVPASFWAVLLLPDMEMLEKMVMGLKSQHSYWSSVYTGAWRCHFYGNNVDPNRGRPQPNCPIRQPTLKPTERCDRSSGTTTRRASEAAESVLFEGKSVSAILGHAEVLWTPKRIAEWRQQIFSDRRSPMQALDNLSNLMCLSADLKQMWASGIFALKPLAYNQDRTQLEVQFFWQPRPGHSINQNIPLLTRPSSTRDLPGLVEDDVVQTGSAFLNVRSEWQKIMSGQRFTFTTPDPIKLPLPSKELLEMQWVLTRLVNLSGAGSLPDGHELDHYENDGIHRFQLS